jgi:putative transposase
LVVEFDLPDLPKPAIETETAIGIDVGFNRFATDSESVADAAHRETFRQIEYKARWRNRNVVYIGRWFPSSQLCSFCGHRHEELSLTDRFWECPACGACHDRDHNAAKNIRDEGMRILLAVGHTER